MTDDSPLKGTFFDTFTFSDAEPPIHEDEEEKKKAEEAKAAEEAAAKAKEKEEAAKKKADDYQVEIEAAATALKEKKEEELTDEEKEFLADYDAGNLKDYDPSKESEKKSDETKETGYDTLVKDLVTEGVLLEPEELEDSVESFSKAINHTVESKVQEWVNGIPEEYRNVIDHFRAGGDINSYIQERQTIDYEGLDYKNPAVQEALVKIDLQKQGYTEEEIEEKLVDLKDLEKMEKEARKSGRTLAKEQDQRLKAADKKIADAIAAREQAEQQEIEDISNAIDKMESIAGFKLTDKRKEAFKKYLFDVDSDGETAASRASKSQDNRIKLYFMDFINYDFSDLVKEATTQKSRDLSNILNRYKDSKVENKGKSVEDKVPESESFEIKFPSMFN